MGLVDKLWIGLIAVVAVVFVTTVAAWLTGDVAVIDGSSMEPTFRSGDIIVTSDTPAEQIEAGDVVTVTVDGLRITHRVTDTETNPAGQIVLSTKGDNNNVQDPNPAIIPAADSVKVVTRSIPVGKTSYLALPILALATIILFAAKLASIHSQKEDEAVAGGL